MKNTIREHSLILRTKMRKRQRNEEANETRRRKEKKKEKLIKRSRGKEK